MQKIQYGRQKKIWYLSDQAFLVFMPALSHNNSNCERNSQHFLYISNYYNYLAKINRNNSNIGKKVWTINSSKLPELRKKKIWNVKSTGNRLEMLFGFFLLFSGLVEFFFILFYISRIQYVDVERGGLLTRSLVNSFWISMIF